MPGMMAFGDVHPWRLHAYHICTNTPGRAVNATHQLHAHLSTDFILFCFISISFNE